MERVGIVIECQGGSAQVAASARGACGHCSEQGGCGLVLIQHGDDRREILTVSNPVQARPGDLVELDLHGPAELKASILVWGLPLVGIIGGGAAGALALPALGLSEDLGVLIGCGLGLLAAWLILRTVDRRAARDPGLRPHIRRVIESRACGKHSSGPAADD